MPSEKVPKAVIFDVGGVIVLSPFQAILEYSQKHNVPKDWINFAIARSGPDGHWQRLERGEIKMDNAFFQGFHADLHSIPLWEEFKNQNSRGKKALKDLANPTQLGDHVSLKAETADSMPTDQDRGSAKGNGKIEENKSFKDLANPSQLGDPTSLKAETANSSPTEHDKGAHLEPKSTLVTSSEKPQPSLSKLAQDTTIGDPVSLESEEVVGPSSSSTSASQPFPTPAKFTAQTSKHTASSLPSLPNIDSTALFWSMMHSARSPDPYIFPALQRLAALPKEKRPIIAALSNTVIFPSNNQLAEPIFLPTSPTHLVPPDSSVKIGTGQNDPMTSLAPYFDVFLSSSQLGMRKPEARIYKYALSEINSFTKQRSRVGGDQGHGDGEIKAEEIIFLDDIGENLRVAREHGWRTIKVQMGKTFRAVKELERAMRLKGELMDEKTAKAKL